MDGEADEARMQHSNKANKSKSEGEKSKKQDSGRKIQKYSGNKH